MQQTLEDNKSSLEPLEGHDRQTNVDDASGADFELGGLVQPETVIVICSPRAAKSRDLADQIGKSYSREMPGRLIAVIVDGEPNASWDVEKQKIGFSDADECFPLPLLIAQSECEDRNDKTGGPIEIDLRVNRVKRVQGWASRDAYQNELEKHRLGEGATHRMLDEYVNAMQTAEAKLKKALGLPT